MHQVADWLEKLNLGQYAERFAENDIDLGILVDLTDQDLEKIGVTLFGHRRKLLRAIAEFKQAEGTMPSVAIMVHPIVGLQHSTRTSSGSGRDRRSSMRFLRQHKGNFNIRGRKR